MCRPEQTSISSQEDYQNVSPHLVLKGSKHPVLADINPGFLTNDIEVNPNKDGENSFIMLTGPNMGGKSTILRQSCQCIIMGQVGSYVPAEFASYSVIDRIFTRLGANDRLISGKSTFYVEMEETSNLINSGSKHSLAIIDELGRGTATFDGVSIASAVMKYIINNLKCRTFFATHYHTLVYESVGLYEVGYFRMDCYYYKEQERIVFLYKLVSGVCEKSFGIDVAKLAGIPKQVLITANEVADKFEDKLSIALKNNVEDQFIKAIEFLYI